MNHDKIVGQDRPLQDAVHIHVAPELVEDPDHRVRVGAQRHAIGRVEGVARHGQHEAIVKLEIIGLALLGHLRVKVAKGDLKAGLNAVERQRKLPETRKARHDV